MNTEHTEKWRELVTRKADFQHILRILNHYYELTTQNPKRSKELRARIAEAKEEDGYRIFFRRIGSYEFEIFGGLREEPFLFDSWFHVDGIQEERDRLKSRNAKDHPVFSILCLSDLYDRDTCSVNLTEVYSQEEKRWIA